MPDQQIRFEAVTIGDALGPSEMYLSKDQVRQYARAMGMWVPRFTDDDQARKEGLPGMITPGNMSLAILSKLVTDWIGAGAAKMTRLGVTYRQPVLPDHTITLHGFITHKNGDDRTVEMDIWIESEEAERLVIGTATVQFSN
jgi:acyl dehydratase